MAGGCPGIPLPLGPGTGMFPPGGGPYELPADDALDAGRGTICSSC